MDTTTKSGLRVVTKVRVVGPDTEEAHATTPEPYRLKTSTVVWFCITVVSLAIIYAF